MNIIEKLSQLNQFMPVYKSLPGYVSSERNGLLNIENGCFVTNEVKAKSFMSSECVLTGNINLVFNSSNDGMHYFTLSPGQAENYLKLMERDSKKYDSV